MSHTPIDLVEPAPGNPAAVVRLLDVAADRGPALSALEAALLRLQAAHRATTALVTVPPDLLEAVLRSRARTDRPSR